LRHIDEAFAARIRFARDRRELPDEADPDALAMLASATLHTLAIRSRAGATRTALQAIVDTTLDVICDRKHPVRRVRPKSSPRG
jgi:hypothetical protein